MTDDVDAVDAVAVQAGPAVAGPTPLEAWRLVDELVEGTRDGVFLWVFWEPDKTSP